MVGWQKLAHNQVMPLCFVSVYPCAFCAIAIRTFHYISSSQFQSEPNLSTSFYPAPLTRRRRRPDALLQNALAYYISLAICGLKVKSAMQQFSVVFSLSQFVLFPLYTILLDTIFTLLVILQPPNCHPFYLLLLLILAPHSNLHWLLRSKCSKCELTQNSTRKFSTLSILMAKINPPDCCHNFYCYCYCYYYLYPPTTSILQTMLPCFRSLFLQTTLAGNSSSPAAILALWQLNTKL